MGGTFEEQINDLIVKGKQWAEDIVNLPAPAPGRTPRGRNNMSNTMTRPTDAPTSNVFRDPNAQRRTHQEILALRDVLAQERRAYAYQNPGYTGGTMTRGKGGGGGGGSSNGNGMWTDPKLLWVGGAALLFFFLYRKKKKKE